MLYVIATASVKQEKRDAFREGAKVCIAATRKEDGCVLYDLHESVTDKTRFVFVEQWTSREALNAHARSAHLKEWRKIAGECTSAPTKIEIITPENVDTL
ncbi:MAG: putative quinol monooxygenase [Beijerinckiaceae bacterium]